MKIISPNQHSKTPIKLLPFYPQERKHKSLGSCCQTGESYLNKTRFSYVSTDLNTTLPLTIYSTPIQDSNFNEKWNNDTETGLPGKEWKMDVSFRILSVTELFGEKRSQNTAKNKRNRQSSGKKQKLEVSLSKRNKPVTSQPVKPILMPKLSQLGRQKPFLKNFSRNGNIVDSVERRLSQLQSYDLICP